MTALVEPALYNSLLSLSEAEETQQALNVKDLLNGPLRDVFLKHGIENAFCPYLQHAHHSINIGEAVVKVEGTAHVMDQSNLQELASFGNRIAPTTWMTKGDKVLPMEFAVVPLDATIAVPTAAFLADFLATLLAYGCVGVLGLDTRYKCDWAETKLGEASVVVPSHGTGYDKEKFIPVSFAFEKDKSGFKVHGKCGKDHRHSSKPKSTAAANA